MILVFLPDDERVYAYVRFETGDEMSRRAKFAFITWIGPSVPPLKKAKVSTDKAFVKEKWNVSNSSYCDVRNLTNAEDKVSNICALVRYSLCMYMLLSSLSPSLSLYSNLVKRF